MTWTRLDVVNAVTAVITAAKGRLPTVNRVVLRRRTIVAGHCPSAWDERDLRKIETVRLRRKTKSVLPANLNSTRPMNLSEEQYDIIEAYLTNELSADDRASFEGDIQSDAELRAEVERQRNLRFGLRALGIERALVNAKAHYQATATSETATPDIEPKPVRPLIQPLTTWRYWAAAASIILLLGTGYYFFRQQVMQRDAIAYAESCWSCHF